MKQLLLKIVSTVLLVMVVIGSSFYFPEPKKATAGIFDIGWCDNFFVCLNPVGDPAAITSAGANAITGGATTLTGAEVGAGLIINGTSADSAVIDTVISPTSCNAYMNANGLFDAIDTAAGSLLGADKTNPSNSFFLGYKVASLQGVITGCWNILETVANNIHVTLTLSQKDTLQSNRALIAQYKLAAQSQLDDFKKQQKESLSDIVTAIATNFASQAAQELAVKGINELQNQFNIKAVGPYKSALTTLNSIAYISLNYKGDAKRQLIASALLQNETIQDVTKLKVLNTAIQQKASEYKVDASSLDWTNSNFWEKVANAGNENVWPVAHLMNGIQDLQAAKASGNQDAMSEISINNGFKSSRPCVSVAVIQQQKDDAVREASEALDEATYNLQLAEEDPTTDESIVDDARSAYATAQANYNATLTAQSAGGFIPQACGPVTQNGTTVNNTISGMVNNLLQTTLPNANNPTLAGKLIGTVFNDIFQKVIHGGSLSQVLDDTGSTLLNLGIGAGLQGSINSITQNSQKPPTINSPTGPNDVLTNPYSPPPYPNNPNVPTNSVGGNNNTTTAYNGFGSVAGAQTTVPMSTTFLPRGPEPVFLPRGPK